jgi:hypothetical protein
MAFLELPDNWAETEGSQCHYSDLWTRESRSDWGGSHCIPPHGPAFPINHTITVPSAVLLLDWNNQHCSSLPDEWCWVLTQGKQLKAVWTMKWSRVGRCFGGINRIHYHGRSSTCPFLLPTSLDNSSDPHDWGSTFLRNDVENFAR